MLDSDPTRDHEQTERDLEDNSVRQRRPAPATAAIRGRAVRRSLSVADLTALVTAFVALQVVFPAQASNDRLALDSEALLFVASIPLWVLLARAMGLYDRDAERPEHTTVDDLVGIVSLVTTVVWLSFVVSYVTGAASPDFGKWVVFWALAIVLIAVARSAARMVVRRRGDLVQRALIVGTDRNAQLVARKLLQHPEYGISLVGFVDASPARLRDEVADVPVLARRGAAADARRRSSRSTASCSGSRARPNARCCGSYGSCRRWACTWTSCPGCSRRSARAPT